MQDWMELRIPLEDLAVACFENEGEGERDFHDFFVCVSPLRGVSLVHSVCSSKQRVMMLQLH